MNSFIGWMGGKKLLRNAICNAFPDSDKYDKYVEVFGGAGWVLFHKDKHAKTEVYNDIDGQLVNLFRCVKYHCGELQRELGHILYSREMFDDFKAQYNMRGLTDIQRAARFFMLIKTSYGMKRTSFGCIKRSTENMILYLDAIKSRLDGVVIENYDFEKILAIYDNKSKSNKPTLFYLDPPYYDTENYYATQFSHDEHMRLRQALQKINGYFVLSYNDCEFVRDTYKGYNITQIARHNSFSAKYENDNDSESYKELIITNF